MLAAILVACGDEDTGEHQMPNGSTMSHAMTPEATMAASHQMGGSPETGVDPDLVFIDAMIIHHQSAVMMAEMALDVSEREEIRTLASDIIDAQETEIEQMGQWREAWFANAGNSDLADMMDMPGMNMTDADMEMMRDAEDFDKMFIDMMIPHHESAIEMAKALQTTTQRPELRTLTEAIITAQQNEIDQMKQWRTEWYGQ